MLETLGTLDLKIARLEQRLRVLEQQQRLSQRYPEHQAKLNLEYMQLQLTLTQFIQQRQELLHRRRSSKLWS